MSDRIQQAIENNAHWCDLVCRSHEVPGQFYEAAWVNEAMVPEFYPNVISLARDDEVIKYIALLEKSGMSGAWGVKDSYASLSLETMGFRLLFNAKWYWRNPMQVSHASDTRFQVVNSGAELWNWEKCWAGRDVAAEHRTFNEALLRDDCVMIIAGRSGNGSSSGLIASSSGPVVGISNVFGMGPRDFNEALAVVGQYFAGLPFVSYDSRSRGGLPSECGFEELGPLRVWLKQE